MCSSDEHISYITEHFRFLHDITFDFETFISTVTKDLGVDGRIILR